MESFPGIFKSCWEIFARNTIAIRCAVAGFERGSVANNEDEFSRSKGGYIGKCKIKINALRKLHSGKVDSVSTHVLHLYEFEV